LKYTGLQAGVVFGAPSPAATNIDLSTAFNTRMIHAMQSDGTGRKQVMLHALFH